MASFSPWSASGLLGGAGQRLAVAAGAVAALWLAVLWATMGVAPPLASQSGVASPAASEPAAPAKPTLRAVAVSGAAAPGGGSYGPFGIEQQTAPAAVNGAGDVAFFAKLMRTGADEALFLSRDGRTALVAATGGGAPGGGTITSFTERPAPSLNASGTVAFAATIEGGRANEAVLSWTRGRLAAIAQSGARAPGVTGAAFFDFGPPAVNAAGDVAFLTTLRRGRETLDAVYATGKGQLMKIAAAGDPAPGGGVFSAFAPPVINKNGVIAFGALVEGGATTGGIYLADAGALRLAVGAGDRAPGGGVFTRLSERLGLDDAGRVAFGAFLGQGGPRSGIFITTEKGVQAVALLGAPAPSGGAFASFGDSPALAPDGGLAFIASVDGGVGTTGVFAYGSEGLARIAGPGDTLADGRRITGFPLNPSVSAGPNGRVAFQALLGSGEEPVDAIVALAPASR